MTHAHSTEVQRYPAGDQLEVVVGIGGLGDVEQVCMRSIPVKPSIATRTSTGPKSRLTPFAKVADRAARIDVLSAIATE
jgi:hypothetical protein